MPTKPKPRAGQRPGRRGIQTNLTLPPPMRDKLGRLCVARAERYAREGISRDPARLAGEVVSSLIAAAEEPAVGDG